MQHVVFSELTEVEKTPPPLQYVVLRDALSLYVLSVWLWWV